MSKLVVTAYVLPDGPVFTVTGRDAGLCLSSTVQDRRVARPSTVQLRDGAPSFRI